MYLLGFDIGSSSVKASLVDAETAGIICTVHSPDDEMSISAPQPGWAEQSPDLWWEHCCRATQKILTQTGIAPESIGAIGISYQMHGLVVIDHAGKPLRPSIIWCDSRAVETGQQAYQQMGEDFCINHYLNAPGNFTASKLRWVKLNEPEVFSQIHQMMLPGDYIAWRMTGESATTVSGLSEGILWDFSTDQPASHLLNHYEIPQQMIPGIVPTFGIQGRITTAAAAETGLAVGTPVTYRAGDQPNNALSLNVLQPGEVAATGGTSGVVYGVVDQLVFDRNNKVNTFAHVNHTASQPRLGVLLCINGAGITHGWMRRILSNGQMMTYPDMEQLASGIAIGSDGLICLPFGNGAERMLGNVNPGALLAGLQFNRHTQAHLIRAELEGIAFSFVYGVTAMKALGLDVKVMRAGNDNLFQSRIFSETIATLLDCRIELMQTTGATGAAIAAGVGIGCWKDVSEGLKQIKTAGAYEPVQSERASYQNAWEQWWKQF